MKNIEFSILCTKECEYFQKNVMEDKCGYDGHLVVEGNPCYYNSRNSSEKDNGLVQELEEDHKIWTSTKFLFFQSE